MLNGEFDLSILDTELQDEIISQTYDINKRGALQVTPKKDMRRAGLPSPDHLDAAIMAGVDPFFEDTYESKTEMYDNDMVMETIDGDDFLADFNAYRW
jgi:GTPase SAR1 family protein